ncbi:hypothetical protein [Streptomyces cinereospinus]|uniref:Tetratricopeptide repeat protein n=1 Tax=Streptomyces cinereospinus TaxID=285561 RepID=A0ABV5N7R7_9ACTN
MTVRGLRPAHPGPARRADRRPGALTAAIGRSGTAYARLDFARAREIDAATLPLLTETAGARHPLTPACTANLALGLGALGRGAEADAARATAVEGLSAALGADRPWLMATRQRRRVECGLALPAR